MMKRLLKTLDVVLGITEPSTEERVTKLLLGVVVPLFPIVYGVSSILSGRSKFLGRFGLMNVDGMAAVAAGIAYLSFGLFVHVSYCWGEHPILAGVVRYILLIVVGLSLLFVLVGVLV
jgi:hypothetical protein